MRNIYCCEEEEEKETKASANDVLMDKFIKTRQILLSGEVNKALAEKINRQLLILEADSSEPIYVFIDSPGGDVDAGFAIFDTVRFINAPVYTVGMGLVASAGALILLAAPKERRLGFSHSRYLIHQPSSGMKGVASDIEIHANEINKLRKNLDELISKETGMDLEKVHQDTNRDCWLDSSEAVSYGLISRIVEKRSELK